MALSVAASIPDMLQPSLERDSVLSVLIFTSFHTLRTLLPPASLNKACLDILRALVTPGILILQRFWKNRYQQDQG